MFKHDDLTDKERDELKALKDHQATRRIHVATTKRAERLEAALTAAEEDAINARKEREAAKAALHAQLSNA